MEKKKTNSGTKKPILGAKKPIADAMNTTEENRKKCFLCGKPATILSPNNRWYCCLACQTNDGS